MRSLWAIAKNTLSQAIRMKVAVAVIVLLVILLPLMSVVMEGDGTPLGKLQTFASYGLGLVSLLLCILTIAVSTFTLSNDLKRKHLYLVVTKPIRRCHIVLGKLLGILILNVFLLAIFGVIIYGLTLAIPKMVEIDGLQRERIDAEFFTARTGLKAAYNEADLKKRAERRFIELRDGGHLPPDMSQSRILSELIGQERLIVKSCPPGYVKRWDFDGVRLKTAEEEDALIFIRYKFETTTVLPDDKVYGTWRIGDLRQMDAGLPQPKTQIYSVERDAATRAYHEFAVPANAVADDGYLGVAFFNNPSWNATTVVMDDIEVLFRSGNFSINFMRSLLVIYVRLVFLAALGVSLTTWLSFPVAILGCLVVFFTGTASGFILDSLEGFGVVYNLTLRPLLWMIPRFDGDYNPTTYIVNGRLIGLSFLATMVLVTVFVKAAAATLLGIWIFSQREIAKAAV